MRAREFVVEDNSVNPAVNNLLTALDSLRNRYTDSNEEPRMRVDSLVNMVRKIPGSEMFNVDTLLSIYDKNPTIRNLIKDVKDDVNGIKIVYLKPAIGSNDNEVEIQDEPETPSKVQSPEKTVDQMSKRALNRRL